MNLEQKKRLTEYLKHRARGYANRKTETEIARDLKLNPIELRFWISRLIAEGMLIARLRGNAYCLPEHFDETTQASIRATILRLKRAKA